MKYRTIVADPPWPVRQPPKVFGNGTANAPLPYPTMTVAEIAALDVAGLADESAHLYLWTVNRFVPDAYVVIAAWGFKPAMLLTWCKEPRGIGPGRQYASTTEFCLFAYRGPQQREPKRIDRNWWVWPRGAHSVKPEAFLDVVEQVSPGPYLELFARRARFGWDYWGDESLGTAEVAAC
jgi:N6-adenosine-specific RNA methylase IME4